MLQYLGLVKAGMNQEEGSILVLDILGGHAAEASIRLRRTNEVTGTCFLRTLPNSTLLGTHAYTTLQSVAMLTSTTGTTCDP